MRVAPSPFAVPRGRPRCVNRFPATPGRRRSPPRRRAGRSAAAPSRAATARSRSMLPERSRRPRSMIADAGAHLAELREDVAADQDRLAHGAQLAQDLAHLDPRPRIEARRGLVEDEQGRVVDEGVGQAQPLPHAARHRLDVSVALVGQADDLEQLVDHGRPTVGGDAVAAGEEVEVLPHAQVVVDAVEVRHVADAPPHLERVGVDRDAGHVRLAGGRGEERGQDASWSSSCRRRWVRPGRRSRPGPTPRSTPATARCSP